MFGRDKIAIIVAEFIGTFTLVSVVLSMLGRTTFPFFAAVLAGSTVGLMTLVIGNASGAHLNPAISIGMWVQRKLDTARTIIYVASQMLGALIAWVLTEWLTKSTIENIAGAKFSEQVLVAEIIGTFIFAFGFSAAITNGYNGLRKAFTIGASLTIGIIVASLASNGIINPAVALGVQSWNISYALGPIVGALLGMSVYMALFAPVTTSQKVKSIFASFTKKKPAKKRK